MCSPASTCVMPGLRIALVISMTSPDLILSLSAFGRRKFAWTFPPLSSSSNFSVMGFFRLHLSGNSTGAALMAFCRCDARQMALCIHKSQTVTAPLFSVIIRFMPHSPKPLRIAPQPNQPPLSKGQRTFNSMVKKIEASRASLTEWQAAVLACDLKVAGVYAPLRQTFRELQTEMVRVLDRALDRKGLSKAEHRVVQEVICTVAEGLIVDTADESIKEIYNKHSDTDFDEEDSGAVESLKSTMESAFGVDLGDAADLDSPEALLAHLEAEMEKQHLREIAEQEARGQRKKTAKQLAREEKIKAEADLTSLSIREVYRKLVSALHPDREPDADERKRKTALMQRVNQAYEKKDLLQLLELQLELEQIDAHTIAGLSEERLKHFNKILEDQWRELEQEIAHLVMPLREKFNLSPYGNVKPEAVMKYLLQDIATLRRHIKQIQKEILLPNNLAAFKVWIKAYRQEFERRDEDAFPFF